MTPAAKKFVIYLRVSTKQQGASGLGMDAQSMAVETHIASEGGAVVGSFTEIESGKNNDRPQLRRAIAHAKRAKATLVVAKLDRLSRNVAFLSALMESKVDFVACDNPTATKFTLHILAAVAEHEAAMISARTKVALAAAKARGTQLGSARPGHWTGRESQRSAGLKKARVEAGKAHDKAFRDVYGDLLADVKAQRDAGSTLKQIADNLAKGSLTTRNGAQWSTTHVIRLLKKA